MATVRVYLRGGASFDVTADSVEVEKAGGKLSRWTARGVKDNRSMFLSLDDVIAVVELLPQAGDRPAS